MTLDKIFAIVIGYVIIRALCIIFPTKDGCDEC